MSPRTKPPAERQAELLDAAQELFVAKGIAATTIEDITNRAGVAKGSFYLQYKSKDDIVVGLQDRFSERFSARLASAVEGKADWRDKLDALVNAFYVGYLREVELHDVLYYYAPVARRERTPSKTAPVDVIRAVLAEGTAAGAFRIDDVELTALLVYHAIHGAFEASWQQGRRQSRAAIVGAAQQLVRRAAGVDD